jgi:hypothetical protein
VGSRFAAQKPKLEALEQQSDGFKMRFGMLSATDPNFGIAFVQFD